MSAAAPALSNDGLPGRVGWKFILAYVAAWTGAWMALLPPVLVGLSLRVQAIDEKNATADLSLVMAGGALVAMAANPLFGHLSDRTASRFGMRRPWLLFGVLLGTASLALIACATALWQ